MLEKLFHIGCTECSGVDDVEKAIEWIHQTDAFIFDVFSLRYLPET